MQEEHDIEPERPPSATQWFVRKRILSGDLPWYEVLDFGPDRDAAYAVDRNLLDVGFERRTIDQIMASFVDEYDPQGLNSTTVDRRDVRAKKRSLSRIAAKE